MKGFTLLELLATIAIVGILSAIAAPSWSRFIDSREIGTIADKAFIALRDAQSQAIQQRIEKVIEFRENNGTIEYSIYGSGASAQVWENIGEAKFHSENDFTQIRFDFKGDLIFPSYPDTFPTLAFTDDRNQHLTCVQVKTLLGAMSVERDENCIP